MLATLVARTPEEVEKIDTQEVINIDIKPETIFEGHALRHEPNHLSAGHASRHDPNVLSHGYASQQVPIRSDTSNFISLNGIT